MNARGRARSIVVSMQRTRIGLTLLTATAALTLLAGCSGGTVSPPARTVTATATATQATTSTTPSADANGTPGGTASCGTASAATAVQQAVATLPRPVENLPDATWDASAADTSGYDPCAALSWAVVSVTGGTPSSPNAILLFHDGTYLGTATAEQYPFEPQVSRTAGDAIAVTYRYATATDSNANPSGSTQASFTWDASARKVTMQGSTPPAS
jgi:hypothetical protein